MDPDKSTRQRSSTRGSNSPNPPQGSWTRNRKGEWIRRVKSNENKKLVSDSIRDVEPVEHLPEEKERPPSSYSVSAILWKIIFCVLSIGGGIVGIVANVSVCNEYYHLSYNQTMSDDKPFDNNAYWAFFWVTVASLIIPALLVTYTTSVIYYLDVKYGKFERPSPWKWFFIAPLTVLLQTPMLWDFEVIYIGVVLLCKKLAVPKAEKKAGTNELPTYWNEENKKLMEEFQKAEKKYELALRRSLSADLHQGVLEGCPQIVVQVYILMWTWKNQCEIPSEYFSGYNPIACFYALRATFSPIKKIYRLIVKDNEGYRKFNGDKESFSRGAKILQSCWHVCIISSRVIALALYAKFSILWLPSIFTIFWLLYTFWNAYKKEHKESSTEPSKPDYFVLYVRKPDYTPWVKFSRFLLLLSTALSYVFVSFKTEDRPIWRRHSIFCLAVFLEYVIALVAVYQRFGPAELLWFLVPIALFLMGIITLCTYYIWFHPSRKFSLAQALRYALGIESKDSGIPDGTDSVPLVSIIILDKK